MRRVAPGTEIGVVGSHNSNASARLHQAVELFHGAHHVGEMLNHMDGQQTSEGIIREGVREPVQIT